MAKIDGPETLLYDVAVSLLSDGSHIHTFRNPAGPIALIGCDWPREDVLLAMQGAPEIHLTGAMARGMGHGIAVMYGGQWLYIATDETKLRTLEQSRETRQ